MKITTTLKTEFTSYLPKDVTPEQAEKLVADFASALGRLPEASDITGRVSAMTSKGVSGNVKAAAGSSLKIKDLPPIVGWFLCMREATLQASHAHKLWSSM